MWLLLLCISTRIPLGLRVCAFGLVPPNLSPGYSGCLCLTSWPRDAADPAPRAAESISHGEKRGEGTTDPCCCLLISVLKVTLSVVSGRVIDFTINY